MEASDVFEEWNEYSKKKKLLGREIGLERMIGNSERAICAVSGMRRSGKSSILMLISQQLRFSEKKTAYVNLEDGRITKRKELLDEIIKWFGDEGYLLLDEIASADDWESWLARTHEMLKGRLRIFVTSSRSGLVVPSKPLRGRILPYELHTLSFPEFLKFKGIEIEKTTAGKGVIEKAFSEYLRLGGFPDVVLATDEIDKVMLLNAYFKDILGLDVAELAHEDVSIVETFGRYVLQGGYFSASKCLNFFKTIGQKIGKEKILALEHYSEEAFLFFFVPIFSYNIKDRAQYPRKAYSGDTGFYYAVAGKQEIGRLFENVVYLELRRRSQGQMQISYWKNRDGLEVDFVVKQGSNIREIIQVSYDMAEEETRSRELDSAVICAKEIGCKEALVITKDERGQIEREGIKIKIISLVDWLIQ
jgi:hypothetical protein